jgi:hypothetical protein
MLKTTTFRIQTGMGTTSQWQSTGLGDHAKALNEIGYTGKFNGVRMSRNTYFDEHVNTDKVTYTLEQTKCDNGDGDFSEAFILIKAEVV